MADGGDTASGDAPSAEGEEAQVAPPPIPSITSTVSGLPISPAYAGVGIRIKAPRQIAFHASRLAHSAPISFAHDYVPQRRGTLPAKKTMEGTGEVFTDPMDNFKAQSFKESSESGTGVEEKRRPENPNKYRNAGKKAYKAENKSNKEESKRHQLRYSQE